MALRQKKAPLKRKPVEGHKVVMLNLPEDMASDIDRFVEEDRFTSRSEWLRNELRIIIKKRG